jgi:hypothetical protein
VTGIDGRWSAGWERQGPAAYAVGISLQAGIATVAVAEGGSSAVLPLGRDQHGVPVALAVGEDGSLAMGDAALDLDRRQPGAAVQGLVERVGDPTPIALGGREYQPPFLIAVLIGRLVDHVRQARGSPPGAVGVACPEQWTPAQADAVGDELRRSGLTGVRLVPERDLQVELRTTEGGGLPPNRALAVAAALAATEAATPGDAARAYAAPASAIPAHAVPAHAVPATPAPRPGPSPAKRTSAGTIVAIVAGGLVLSGLIFALGLVVGYALGEARVDDDAASESDEASNTTDAPDTTDEPVGPSGDAVQVASLQTGDCILEFGVEEAEVDIVEVVSCDQPHFGEVYGVPEFDEPRGAPYPGDEAIVDEADRLCVDLFEPYVGAPYDESELFFEFLTPTAEGWDLHDRGVVCYATARGGSLEESVRDSGR